MNIVAVTSTNVLYISKSHFDTVVFSRPVLSEADHLNVSRLVIDILYDTACTGNHVFVEEFFMGEFITARGFTTSLGSLDNIFH